MKDDLNRIPVSEPIELLKFIFATFPKKSRTEVKTLLANKQILVNDEPVSQFNYMLQPGQHVRITKVKQQRGEKFAGLKIIHQDQHIIIIEKDAGLLSVSTDNATDKQATAYNILSDHVKKYNSHNKVFIVHRIDRETSGLMIFARSEEVQAVLQENWTQIVLERGYLVVVEGVIHKKEGTISSWLKENKALIMYSSSTDNGGQYAVTHYKVLKANDNYTMIKAELETGRKNQIRVHLLDIGHPVVGDKKYGATHDPIKRLALHAYSLTFIHPVSQKEMRFVTDTPKAFEKLVS